MSYEVAVPNCQQGRQNRPRDDSWIGLGQTGIGKANRGGLT